MLKEPLGWVKSMVVGVPLLLGVPATNMGLATRLAVIGLPLESVSAMLPPATLAVKVVACTPVPKVSVPVPPACSAMLAETSGADLSAISIAPPLTTAVKFDGIAAWMALAMSVAVKG